MAKTDLPVVRDGADLVPKGPEQKVWDLLAQGTERGLDVSSMGALVDLYERVEKRSAEKAFAHARSKFQRECPPVQRDTVAKVTSQRGGSGYEFRYVKLEALMEHTRPHLEANGFSIWFDAESTGNSVKAICRLRHELGHEEHSSFQVPTENASGASPQQKFGGALTYAKRQALISVLGLAVVDPDPDADEQAARDALPRVSEEQAATLRAKCAEVGVPESQFCGRYRIGSVSELPEPQYKAAVQALEAHAKKGGRK